MVRLLNQIGMNTDYLENASINKIVVYDNNKLWNFVINNDRILPVYIYNELINKIKVTFSSIDNIKLSIVIDNDCDEYINDYVDNLINALKDISKRYLKNDDLYPKFKYDSPFAVGIIRPRTAYHAPLKVVDLDDALGLISKESIMIYPPGIPLIIPGEIFNEDVIARIKYYKSKNATVLSDYPDKVSVIDFKTWDLYDKHKKDLEEYYESIKRHE